MAGRANVAALLADRFDLRVVGGDDECSFSWMLLLVVVVVVLVTVVVVAISSVVPYSTWSRS